MKKMIIKVTLNSLNPLEAELIRVLENVKKRSAHLKMAAVHYWNILGKISPSNDHKNDACPDMSKTGVDSDLVNTGKEQSKNTDEIEINFANTFDELK